VVADWVSFTVMSADGKSTFSIGESGSNPSYIQGPSQNHLSRHVVVSGPGNLSSLRSSAYSFGLYKTREVRGPTDSLAAVIVIPRCYHMLSAPLDRAPLCCPDQLQADPDKE
jgi:hypothetical protein